MKTAIIIISDPQSGEESLSRAINGLAVAHDAAQNGDDVAITFVGTGTRWPDKLSELSHPGNGLYNLVREHVAGASRACAARWGATEGLQARGVALLSNNQIPGTPGAASVRHYLAEGWQTLVF